VASREPRPPLVDADRLHAWLLPGAAARRRGGAFDAGARTPVRVEVVDAIAREPGHAAEVKLVVSEVGRPSNG